MSESHDISNHSGPGSAAEPSMEEILASIRRILKEDEGTRAPAEDDDDDLLVLDSSMIVNPADISSATELPVDTGLIAAHDEAPLTTYHEPVHFVSEPTIHTHDFEAAPSEPAYPENFSDPEPVSAETVTLAAEPEPAPPEYDPAEQLEATAAEHPRQSAAEPAAPAPETHEEDHLMEDHVQSPDGLVGDDATSAIASTIGSLVRSISNERAVSVSRGGITIEDIVREEIRPIMKAWLDTHLPSLVERIVRAEIGRVIDRTQV